MYIGLSKQTYWTISISSWISCKLGQLKILILRIQTIKSYDQTKYSAADEPVFRSNVIDLINIDKAKGTGRITNENEWKLKSDTPNQDTK